MGSANGTELDGKRLEPYKNYPLKHNSKVGLGIVSGAPRVILCFKESPATVRAPIPQTNSSELPNWLKIDENRKEVVVNNQIISLSKKEYSLISLLHNNTGRIFSKDEIINSLWPEVKDPGAISDAAIDQLVYRLRKRIEPNPSQPRYIISKKGFGFMLSL
jgi:DNA-binding response OmpR family regulator